MATYPNWQRGRSEGPYSVAARRRTGSSPIVATSGLVAEIVRHRIVTPDLIEVMLVRVQSNPPSYLLCALISG